MSKTKPRREPPATAMPARGAAVSAEAALSFLKDTKGAVTWTASELAAALRIQRPDAGRALAFLQAQGYVQPQSGGRQWMTTPAGEAVSGAKTPRFSRESVEEALAVLKERIRQNNRDAQAPYRVAQAVAFGDFLLEQRARVQTADVGVGLVRRERPAAKEGKSEVRSATEARAERAFLRQLRSRSALLNLRPYAAWMSQRTHRDLL